MLVARFAVARVGYNRINIFIYFLFFVIVCLVVGSRNPMRIPDKSTNKTQNEQWIKVFLRSIRIDMIVIISGGGLRWEYIITSHLVPCSTMFPMFPMVDINIRLALGVYWYVSCATRVARVGYNRINIFIYFLFFVIVCLVVGSRNPMRIPDKSTNNNTKNEQWIKVFLRSIRIDMIVIISGGGLRWEYIITSHLVPCSTMFPMFPMVDINIRLALGVYWYVSCAICGRACWV